MSISQNYPTISPSLNLDFANVKKLDPRITFARASTGAFYDGQTVSLAEQNLLLQSQTFDVFPTWVPGSATITANAATAPDGTMTADKLVEDSTTAPHHVLQTVTSSTADYVFSFFAKADGRSWVHTRGTFFGATYFDVTNGVLGTVPVGVTASITDFGNGWYRCTASGAVTGGGNTAQIACGSADNTDSTLGDGVSGVFLWGAQLEARSTITAYQPTTTQPITNYIPTLLTAPANSARFDHNPVTGESLGLLVEEQRTNLVTYSEDLSNAAWIKSAVTVSSNQTIAPDGTLTADKVIQTATTAFHFISQPKTGLATATYTLSFYAKPAELQYLNVITNNNINGLNSATIIDLGTGAITSASLFNATSTAVGNGWYRYTFTGLSSGFYSINLYPNQTSTASSELGDGYSGIYIWGAQLEAGAFPTSYIPTVASQVTRSADSASMTGANFSSWYNQGQSTIYAEAVRLSASTNSSRVFTMQDSSGIATNQLSLGNIVSPGTNDNAYVQNLPNTLNASLGLLSGNNVTFKVCLAVDANGIYASKNGALTQTTLGTINQGYKLTRLVLGNVVGSSQYLNGTIKKIAYYPQRLSNENLQALTS
jgi:hypothetical protein